MNSCNFIGRLATEPKVELSASGNEYCKFPLAVESGSKKRPKPYYHTMMAHNGTAKNIAKFLHKGSLVAVETRAENYAYLDENKVFKKETYFVIDKIDFLDQNGFNVDPTNDYEDKVPDVTDDEFVW